VRPAPWAAERLLAPDTAVLAEALGRRPGIARALRRLPFAGRVPALGATVVTVHRPGEPVGAWLREFVPAADPRRLLVASVHAGRGLVVVWPTHGREPIAYVKLGEVGREGGALGELAVGAARAGVRVPRVLGRSEDALAVEALPGRRASWVLAERPGRLPEVAGAVTDALVRWHDAVAVERPLAADDVERHLLRPARALAHLLAPGYAERLEREARALLGRPVPFSVSHGDLTMANVLLGDGPPAFVDWEAASADMLPFVDLPYALADAAAARDRYADRPAAFSACFEVGGAERDLAARLIARAATARGTSPDVLRLSFHACWLRHAVDDLGKGAGDAPFVQIAARLSATPELFDPVPA
jgi:hypothetical protein